MKKLIVILVILLTLCGCGKKTEIQVESNNVKTIEVSPLKFDYDGDTWQEISALLPSIALKSEIDTNNLSNINIQLVAEYSSKITEDDLNYLIKNILPYQTIDKAEIVEIDGSDCIEMIVRTKITDEAIDLMINEGTITAEQVEQAGGREALTSLPETTALQIYAVKKGYLILFTGTYFTTSSNEKVHEGIETLIKTCHK